MTYLVHAEQHVGGVGQQDPRRRGGAVVRLRRRPRARASTCMRTSPTCPSRGGDGCLERGTMSRAVPPSRVRRRDSVASKGSKSIGAPLTLIDPRGETVRDRDRVAAVNARRGGGCGRRAQGWPRPPQTRPATSAALFAARPELGSLEFGFHADKRRSYLRDIGEALPLYRGRGASRTRAGCCDPPTTSSSPTWSSVRGSTCRVTPASRGRRRRRVQHPGPVIDDFERKGHKFVVLDVLIVANDVRPVVRFRHTRFNQPRRTG